MIRRGPARNARVRIAPEVLARTAASGDDVFEAYPPPFDILSDMLLVGATCPADPLLATFPDVDFLIFRQRAVLGIWFARVLEIRSGPEGGTLLDAASEPENLPYQELNVGILLRGRRLFVPGIYATTALTIRLGHRYGMPKRHVQMTYQADAAEVSTRVEFDGAASHAHAHIATGGRRLGAALNRTLPWWSWPVLFPSGSYVEGRIERVDRARLAWVIDGKLALNEPWLPQSVPLWRVALHLPRQRMRLPAPEPHGSEPAPPTASDPCPG